MNKGTIFAVVVLFALALGVAGYVALSGQMQNTGGEEVPPTPSIEKQYETVLNTMLQDVAAGMKEYKTLRNVYTDLVRPENLRSPEYVVENERIMQETRPRLDAKMEEVVTIFEEADAAMKGMQAGNGQDRVTQSWQSLKNRQVGPYLEYFSKEKDLLDSYAALMMFYKNHAGQFSYDPDLNQLVFENPEHQKRAEELRAAISNSDNQ